MPIRFLLPTIVTALIVVFLFSQRHAGIGLVFLALILLPWLLYSAYVIVRKPQLRWFQISKIAIWFVAVSTIVGVHYYLSVSTRARADAVVVLVHQYSKVHGVCPANVEVIGLSKEQLHEQLGLSSYTCKDGEMMLFYAATWVPFDTEWYDFKQGKWVYRGD